MSLSWRIALAFLVACGGSRGAKQPGPPLDIWDLAPPGTLLVVALEFDEGYQLLMAADRALKGAPGTQPAIDFIGGWLNYPRVDMRSAAARRGAGYDPDGPHVYFVTDRGIVSLSRIADRAAYNRTFQVRPEPKSRGRLTIDADGSTCAAKAPGGYQLCGQRELVLAILDGKGMRVPWPRGGAAPSARIWLAESILGPVAGLTTGGDGLRVELELERGRLVARAHLTGEPSGQIALFGAGRRSPLAAALPPGDLSGAAVINLIAYVDAARAQAIENMQGEMLAGVVAWSDVWDALRGDASFWVAADDQTGALAIGLRKTAVFRKLLARCEDLTLPGMVAARDGSSCRLRSAEMKKAGLGDVVVRVSDDALVAEMTSAVRPAPAPASASPRLARLRKGEDGLALFGSGLFAQLWALTPASTLDEDGQLGLWLLLHVTESAGWLRVDGDGLRAELRVATTWQYDDPTIAAIEPIFRRMVTGEPAAGAELGKLPAARQGGPLARDLARGKAGSVVPLVAGLLIVRVGAEAVSAVSAAKLAGVEVLDDFEEVAEGACRCKDAECAEKAAARYDKWNAKHGETKVDNAAAARLEEMAAEYHKCMAPFVSEE